MKMIINADVFVKDVPGQLVGSLEPISLVDGNIVGVVHNRDSIMNGRIGVNITFEIGSAEGLESLKKIWRSRDVTISRMSSVVETFPTEYVLIGNISPLDIEKLMNKAGKAAEIESTDIRYSSKMTEDKKTVMISVNVKSEDDLEELNTFMMSSCRRSGIVCIRSV